jgi:hypothetical protein
LGEGGEEAAMELNSGPSEVPDRTSGGKIFNLAELVLIIGYRLTAYIGGSANDQSVIDWLRNGLPPGVETRLQATLDVVAPIAQVESELVAQGFLIGQWHEIGAHRSPARMLREADIETARSVLIKLAVAEFLSNEIIDPEDAARRLRSWISHAELPKDVAYTCRLWQGRLALILVYSNFPAEVQSRWDEGLEWPCWNQIIEAVPEMARSRLQVDLTTGFPFRYLRPRSRKWVNEIK